MFEYLLETSTMTSLWDLAQMLSEHLGLPESKDFSASVASTE
jgi:hypothetical protein